MRPFRAVTIAVFALLLASPALAAGKGTTLFSIGLSNGTADLYGPSGSNYITAFSHSEIGVSARSWYYMNEDYAVTLDAALGFFSETDKPGNGAATGASDEKYTQNSYSLRLGGDRMVKVGDRATFYFGPGLEYWVGKAKWDHLGPNTESENVTRYSLSSRIGAMMNLTQTVSLGCNIGRKLGVATADDLGRKVMWWPSSFDATGGVIFKFGK